MVGRSAVLPVRGPCRGRRPPRGRHRPRSPRPPRSPHLPRSPHRGSAPLRITYIPCPYRFRSHAGPDQLFPVLAIPVVGIRGVRTVRGGLAVRGGSPKVVVAVIWTSVDGLDQNIVIPVVGGDEDIVATDIGVIAPATNTISTTTWSQDNRSQDHRSRPTRRSATRSTSLASHSIEEVTEHEQHDGLESGGW